MLSAGIDYSSLWTTVNNAASTLVTQDLPAAAQKAVVQQAENVLTPVAQQVAAQKASTAVSAGNVTLLAVIGGGVGLVMGALIAGGSWKRRAVGGGIAGAVAAGAGALAGFRIGLLKS